MKPRELTRWREVRGLSMRRLAGLLGVTHAAVSRWESGKRGVNPLVPGSLKALERKYRVLTHNPRKQG